jgi:predicted transcriptional regulator of viral defense system
MPTSSPTNARTPASSTTRAASTEGVVFKRLGFLVSKLAIEAPDVIDACRSNLSAGYSRLDPTEPKRGRLVRRWRLQVNATISQSE